MRRTVFRRVGVRVRGFSFQAGSRFWFWGKMAFFRVRNVGFVWIGYQVVVLFWPERCGFCLFFYCGRSDPRSYLASFSGAPIIKDT